MSYWQDKRVAVTGGAGMVGSHLVEMLINLGASVTVLDDFSRGKHYVDGAKYNLADAGLLGPCQHSFAATDVVFNLAAYVAGVLYNQDHHAQMFNENIRLQTQPAIAAAQCHVPVFVQMSSVCVYATGYNAPAIEVNGHIGEPVKANNGYSWSKRMGERAALWSGVERVVIVRPSNIYGPRDYFDDRAHVIPALIKKCLEQDTVLVHGSGEEHRDFLYVEDAARGLLAAAEHGTHQEAYNLSPGTQGHTSIRSLLRYVQDATDTIVKPIRFTGGEAGDAVRYSSTIKTDRDLLWTAAVGLADGIDKTVAWYRGTR